MTDRSKKDVATVEFDGQFWVSKSDYDNLWEKYAGWKNKMGKKPHPVTIRGVEYNSPREAAKAFGLTVHTIKSARQNGTLDNVGLGTGYRSNESARRGYEKTKVLITVDGVEFLGWEQAKEITGLSRSTLLRKGAKVTRGGKK